MNKMDVKPDPSKFFTGSSAYKYEPTEQVEAGIGYSLYHSMSAMKQYQNVSFEELRNEDYIASGGFFGSKFAKLSGAMCVSPTQKWRPFCYAELFKEAIDQVVSKQKDSKDTLTDGFQAPTQIQKPNDTNLTFQGSQNIKIFVKCVGDSGVNFSFKDAIQGAERVGDSGVNFSFNDAIQDVEREQTTSTLVPYKKLSCHCDRKSDQSHSKSIPREKESKVKRDKKSVNERGKDVSKRPKHCLPKGKGL